MSSQSTSLQTFYFLFLVPANNLFRPPAFTNNFFQDFIPPTPPPPPEKNNGPSLKLMDVANNFVGQKGNWKKYFVRFSADYIPMSTKLLQIVAFWTVLASTQHDSW